MIYHGKLFPVAAIVAACFLWTFQALNEMSKTASRKLAAGGFDSRMRYSLNAKFELEGDCMNITIKGNKRLISAKTRFMFAFSDLISELHESESEKIKAMIEKIADDHDGFSITVYLNDGRKMRYVGFVYGENWRIAYFYDGIPHGHFDDTERFLDEVALFYENGYDLYVKAV